MTVTEGHLDAVEAQLRLALVQVAALRQHLAAPATSSEPDLPPACAGVPEHLCARRCDDARVDVGGMGGGPARWVCRGCGEEL